MSWNLFKKSIVLISISLIAHLILYTERGSLARTIAHELGHVLGLKNNRCKGYCLKGPKQGYKLWGKNQIRKSRIIAKKRIKNNCQPLTICKFGGEKTFFN